MKGMLLLSSLSLSFSLFNSTVTFGVCLPTQPNLDNSSQACPDAPFLDDSWGCQVDNQCKQSQCFVIFFIKFPSELLQKKKRKKIDHHCPKYLEYLFHLLTHQIYNVTDYDDKIEKNVLGISRVYYSIKLGKRNSRRTQSYCSFSKKTNSSIQ